MEPLRTAIAHMLQIHYNFSIKVDEDQYLASQTLLCTFPGIFFFHGLLLQDFEAIR